MSWFRNLNASARLMLSFGVLMVFICIVGYLGVNSLNAANERIDRLYHDDMQGALAASDMSYARVEIGRNGRDAILMIDNSAQVTKDEKGMLGDFAKIHASLAILQKSPHSKEGDDALALIGGALPAYEKGQADMYAQIREKDAAGAKLALDNVVVVSKPVIDGIAVIMGITTSNAETRFQQNGKSYQSTRNLIIGATGFSLLVSVLLSIVIARGFSVPLSQAVVVLEKVAEGDLTVTLDVDTEDEVGRMASALNRALQMLNITLQKVADSAASASSSSQQLAAASEAISSGAQEQAASLEETSASLEEITAAVRQSADNAQQASQLAAGSKDSALQGQEVVAKAVTAMSDINDASAKISDIISTIDEIAFQTNLLAVNAAVEAARAGDEGRGFAVVATEVRSLAQRSAVAAKEIKVLIQDTLHKVEVGSSFVNRSGETLQGIVGSVKRVTDIVSEMAAAAGEQSTGIEQVNTAMTQMDQVTQSNSAQTEELSATAESLSEQAAHLLELVSTFTLSHEGGGQRDRQTPQQHGAVPVYQPSSVRHLSSVSRQPERAVRSNVAAKPEFNGRGTTRVNSRQSALTITRPSAPVVDDASFQEF